jgi:hypothetical protein
MVVRGHRISGKFYLYTAFYQRPEFVLAGIDQDQTLLSPFGSCRHLTHGKGDGEIKFSAPFANMIFRGVLLANADDPPHRELPIFLL